LLAGVAGGDGKFGSLVYAAGFVVVWWAVLRAMDAMGWRIRV
jgi:predicted acyltransferase